MASSFPWDALLNVVFFTIGFIVGLAQLWQAQKYYLAEQQSKYSEINEPITEIAQRLAVIEEVTNRLIEIDRTLAALGAVTDSYQERLLGIVEQQVSVRETVGKVTAETSDQIVDLLQEGLSDSGMVTPEDFARLEASVDRLLGDYHERVIRDVVSSIDAATISYEPRSSLVAGFSEKELAEPQPVEIEVNETTRQVRLQGEEVKLTDKEYKLLQCLAQAAGKIVGKDQIAEFVWAEATGVSDAAIDALVYRLRNKLGDDAREKKYIRTIPGEGFMLQRAMLYRQ